MRIRAAPQGLLRSGRRRSPTGEPPPLPHHLPTSGVGWPVAAAMLVALPIVVFARGLHGMAVAVTAADDAPCWNRAAGLDEVPDGVPERCRRGQGGQQAPAPAMTKVIRGVVRSSSSPPSS